jgi:hypothetical protein
MCPVTHSNIIFSLNFSQRHPGGASQYQHFAHINLGQACATPLKTSAPAIEPSNAMSAAAERTLTARLVRLKELALPCRVGNTEIGLKYRSGS